MLSLTDFYRIKESSLYWPGSSTTHHPSLFTLSSLDTSKDYLTKAEKHKNKLRSYDKKNPYHPLMTYENKKVVDPYSIVSKEDDALKEINILCKNAKIATIRDKQLDEKKFMDDIYKRKEEKLDFMMELERLKEIKFKEEQEKENKKLNLDSQKIIIEQILDNERERLKKREQIEKDKLQMKMQLEKMEEEEKKRILKEKHLKEEQLEKMEEEEKKRILKEKHLKEERVQECIRADRLAILQKQKKKIEERELELKDYKYNIEKAKREEEYLKEKKRIALQKEKEIQALREKQEKAQDKQAELDAIRAKRVYEETERKAKLKEKEEELLKAKKMKECIEEKKHRKIKEEMKANEIMKEKEEYERMAKERQREIEEEKEKQRQKIKLLMENGNMNDAYYNNLDLIKKQKIEELRALNIKDKYILPVEKYNPIKSLRMQGV